MIEGDLEELAKIVSCPRCGSDNLKILKSKFDEWFEQHRWFRVIVMVLFVLFLVVVFVGWIYDIFPSIMTIITVILWLSSLNPFLTIGVVLVVLATVFLWRRKKLKERKKAAVWELEDQLEELKERLDRGVITQEEYEQKRKNLQKRPL